MEFSNPLSALLIIPGILIAILLTFFYLKDIEKTKKIFSKNLEKIQNFNINNKRRKLIISIPFVCILLSIIILLEPLGQEGSTIIKTEGADIVFAVDISKSMLAQDLDENSGISRLEMSKAILEKIVESRPGDRFGLVVFAGDSFVVSPITFDKGSFLNFINSISTSIASQGGTNFENAIKESVSLFNKDAKRGKAIILISDGEDHEGSTDNVLKEAKEAGINIFTIGVGSEEGGKIIESVDIFGNVNYKSFNGEIVKTKINEKELKKIASKTDSKYFRVKKLNDANAIIKELSNLKIDTAKIPSNEKSKLYFIFAVFMGVLFSIYVFMPDKKKKVLVLLISFFIFNGCYIEASFYSEKGRDKYKEESYSQALSYFEKATEEDKKNAKFLKNKGDVFYRQDLFDEAKKEYSLALDKIKDDKSLVKSEIFYNLGNTNYRIGEKEKNSKEKLKYWEDAISNFEETLKINPENNFAKENIEFIKDKIKKLKEENKDLNQQKEKKEDQKNKEKESDKNKNKEEKNNQENKENQKKKEEKMSDEIKKQLEQQKEKLKQNQKRFQNLFRVNPKERKTLEELWLEQQENANKKDW